MATTVAEKVIRIDVIASAEAQRNIKALATDLKKVEGNVGSLNDSFKRFSGVGNILRTTLGVLGTLGIAASLQDIAVAVIRAADGYAVLNARFLQLTGSASQTAQAVDDVFKISIESGKSLDGVAKLYEKATRAGQQFGIAQKDVAKITEGFAQSLRVSGASTQEAQAALIQFGQALASGRLQGDEFRSLTENNAFFMNEFAKATGKTLAELKKLGSEGKLTTTFFFDNLLKVGEDGLTVLDRINQAAARIPLTLEQSFASLGTALSGFIGEAYKVFSAINDGNKGPLQQLAVNIDASRKSLQEFGEVANAAALGPLDKLYLKYQDIVKVQFEFLKNFLGIQSATTGSGGGSGDVLSDQLEKTRKEIADIVKVRDALANGQKTLPQLLGIGVTDVADANAQLAALNAKLQKLQALRQFQQAGSPDLPNIDKGVLPKAIDETAAKNAAKDAERLRNELQRTLEKITEDRILLQREITEGPEIAKGALAKLQAGELAKASAEGLTNVKDLNRAILEETTEADRLQGVLDAQKRALETAKDLAERTAASAGDNILTKVDAQLIEFRQKTTDAKLEIVALRDALAGTTDKSEASFLKKRIEELELLLDPTIKKTRDLSRILEDNLGKAIDDIAGKFADFILGVDTSFSDLIQSILKNILKLTIQDFVAEQLQLITDSIKKFSAANGGGGGLLGGVFGIAKAIFSANGNVMTGRGPMELNKYANGGIARTPQISVFGEGRRPEAYVPLPDGRSIPVSMSGGDSGLIVNVYNQSGDSEVRTQQSRGPNNERQLDIMITKKVRAVIQRDVSSGEGVAKTLESRYNLGRA